jgi:hypothetical protein
MLRKLFLAEKTGIIESEVDNVQDQPLQVWRSHLKPPEEKLEKKLDKPVKEPET